VRRAVRRALADLPSGELVLVACSGGGDSTALAAATAFEAPRAGLRAGAVTVDHDLQSGSAARAARVAATLTRLGLAPVEIATVSVGRAGGPEAAARTARYAALEEAGQRLGAAAVLLGHSRDDQAETVLLGLARGSGARSLAGMAPRRGCFRRPLLDVDRATLRAACVAAGLVPEEDPHNADGSYTRVRVRRLLPALQAALGGSGDDRVSAALARTAAQLRDDADALDAWADAAVADCADGEGGLRIAALDALPSAVRRRVLHRAARAAGSPGGALSAGHVQALDALVTDWRGQGPLHLPGHVRARRRYGRLVLTGAAATTPGRSRVDESDMGDALEKVLVPAAEIQARIVDLAKQIDHDYAGRDLLLVGVLKGAVMVMADLSRALRSPAEMDWMAVSSYGSGTKSSGVVRILKDLDGDISGRHVLVVEDVVDSGLTLSWLIENLRSRGPASIEVMTLLRKPEAAKIDVSLRYVGFEIPNEFVVGYGLDYAQRYRNLPFVGTLAPHVYAAG
jgi:hypoxanthine phosphoribosyltransferase